MLDESKLRQGLEVYRQTLIDHRYRLTVNFEEVTRYFFSLQQTLGGQSAENFNQSFERTAQWFHSYLDETGQLLTFLTERLEKLIESDNIRVSD
ncbi:hypothetical protein [Endothiovibrio diazotrophicus]